MEHAVTLAVPLEFDMHTGHNWYELKQIWDVEKGMYK